MRTPIATQMMMMGAASTAPATWDPAWVGSPIALSSGNLVATTASSGSVWRSTRTTTAKNSGKRLAELRCGAGANTSGNWIWGLLSTATTQSNLTYISSGASGGIWLAEQATYRTLTGASGFTVGAYTSSTALASSAYLQVAIDFSAGKLWITTAAGTGWMGGGNPDSGTSPSFTFTTGYSLYIATSLDSNGANVSSTLNTTGLFNLNPGNVTTFSPWG